MCKGENMKEEGFLYKMMRMALALVAAHTLKKKAGQRQHVAKSSMLAKDLTT